MNKPIAEGEGTRSSADTGNAESNTDNNNASNYLADALASNSFTDMDKFKLCCREIMLEGNANWYAKAYAEYWSKVGLSDLDIYEAKVQALYILNNLFSWRSSNAKIVRVWLKNFC